MNFKRFLKGAILGLLIGVVIGGILSILMLNDNENYAVKDNLSKWIYTIFITITLPIFLFGIVLGFINSLRKSKKEKSKIILILKLIIAFVIAIFLFLNVVDILPEIKYKECIYVMDEISESCKIAYPYWINKTYFEAENIKDCSCQTDYGRPLFVEDEFYEIEINKDSFGNECVYHKECKEIEEGKGYYNLKKIEQYKEKDIRNIDVVIHGPNVIRSGNKFIVRLLIKNANKRTDIFIKNIKFLDSNKKVIENFEINATFKPVGNEISSINKMSSRINKSPFFYLYYMLASYYDKNLEKTINKISSNSYQQSFTDDLRKFSDSWVLYENVTIFIEIEVKYDNNDYIVKKQHSILISEQLPSPPHD